MADDISNVYSSPERLSLLSHINAGSSLERTLGSVRRRAQE